MRPKLSRYALAAALAVVVLPAALRCQELDRATLQEVKERVLAEVVRSLPEELPAGYLAVLPPEIVAPDAVSPAVATTWVTGAAEALQALRPEIRLTDRTLLEAILREQKFGDSVYADPTTAVEVGKLAAARMLLLTRLHEFRPEQGRVRVHLEAILVDVETGANLSSREYSRGLFPIGVVWLVAALALVVAVPLLIVASRIWKRRRRARLVEEKLPDAHSRVRVDVDGLVHAVNEARERLYRAGREAPATAVQNARVDLDPVLDRVRHALPGGAVDRSRLRDLRGALREAARIGSLIDRLRQASDETDSTGDAGEELAERLRQGATELRRAVDAYRGYLV
ncbi:MAG: hypothetical protein GY856_30520 [bacterium]|nr:hypothetical protein [bacterium]